MLDLLWICLPLCIHLIAFLPPIQADRGKQFVSVQKSKDYAGFSPCNFIFLLLYIPDAFGYTM